MRIDADVWLAAVEKAKDEGTTVTALVEQFLREYADRLLRTLDDGRTR